MVAYQVRVANEGVPKVGCSGEDRRVGEVGGNVERPLDGGYERRCQQVFCRNQSSADGHSWGHIGLHARNRSVTQEGACLFPHSAGDWISFAGRARDGGSELGQESGTILRTPQSARQVLEVPVVRISEVKKWLRTMSPAIKGPEGRPEPCLPDPCASTFVAKKHPPAVHSVPECVKIRAEANYARACGDAYSAANSNRSDKGCDGV